MDDLIKNNKTLLFFILLLGLGLRLWDLNRPMGIWVDEYNLFSMRVFDYPFDFFQGLKTNCYAPLHSFYVNLWMRVFRNSDFLLKMSSLIPNLAGCLVMYFVGKNYQTKDSSTKIGLFCALISAISVFLISFCQETKVYSMTFFLTTLILLFSIKTYENPCKKNYWYLTTFSALLILEHTIGFLYVIFNTFALIAFKQKQKKKKDEADYFIPVLSGLVLCLPLIPFLFRIFAHPTYFSQWWMPFSWSKIYFYFTDLFSPVLRNITHSPSNFYNQIILNDNINFGFVIFALTPALIALVLIIKSNIESKRINKYFLCVCTSTFLTVLIATITGKINFLTKYLTELYPLLILMFSIGWAQLNSRNTRIMLLTVYLFLTLFYIVITRLGIASLT